MPTDEERLLQLESDLNRIGEAMESSASVEEMEDFTDNFRAFLQDILERTRRLEEVITSLEDKAKTIKKRI